MHAPRVLALLALTSKIVCTLQALHLSNLDSLDLDSLIDFQMNIDVELSFWIFLG